MSISFTEQTKGWVKFLSGVSTCHFIGDKSTGKSGEKFGELCMKSSMKRFMEETGWYYQEYLCGYFNGTERSCKNGDKCKFSHKRSPRWVKGKPRRNFGSSSQASSSDNVSEELSVVSTVTEMSMPQTTVSVSSTPSGSWAGKVVSSPPKARNFSFDPEIKKWQQRLYDAEDCLEELRTELDFDEIATDEAFQQCEKAIKKAKKKISDLRKKKTAFSWADDESSDDEA